MNLSSILKSYTGHLAAYVVSGAAIISGLDPKLIPPQYSFITALAALVVTAAHHGFTAGNAGAVAAAVLQAAQTAASSAIVKAAAPVLVMLMLMTSMSGCSILSQLTTPAAQPYVTAAVDIAVATAEQKGISATQINGIAKTALTADAGTSATLATVSIVVNAQLAKLNLPAGDLVAAQILEDALNVAIQAEVGSNPNIATAQAAIADVLTAAIVATGG
jgi:uncharacterized protein YceK